MNKPLKYGLFLVFVIFAINCLTYFIIEIPINLIYKNQSVINSAFNPVILIASFISAIIISLLVVTTAPVLKDFLSTWRTLLRLDSLSHPLLIRLSTEAPGTYNHSLAVANLAHRVAKSIGADALLARVGSYYHDIGKLVNPILFIENQTDTENVHEDLNPIDSAKIIISHVEAGVELASDNHIPSEIINIIAEHHGNSLLTYFYEKARELGIKPKKNDFRYHGPKPMSIESVIVMLSDAIEAKIRLSKIINNDVIIQTVNEIIQSKLDEDQLELSGINATKLSKIRTSLIDALKIVFHQRIVYPKKVI